jgi:hypothetical protein
MGKGNCGSRNNHILGWLLTHRMPNTRAVHAPPLFHSLAFKLLIPGILTMTIEQRHFIRFNNLEALATAAAEANK